MIKRIISDIILFFSIFWLAWYWTVLIILIFMIFFEDYWEGVAATFFMDILFSKSFGIFTVLSLIFFFFIGKMRTNIRYGL
ncbi:MAG: hypothetical protein AB1643_00430 [Patescibacteria group bacterium]